MGSPNMHDERLRKTLARNLKLFLSSLELSENALAQKSKISQKQVNNITQARTGCGIDALSEIASVLGCEPWVLLLDHLTPRTVAHERRLARVVRSYLAASEADQDLIEALVHKTAGREAAA